MNNNIQSEANVLTFCFNDIFCLIFGRRDYRFYDNLSRLIEADCNNGTTVYNYGYDVAGNMVDYDGVIRTYNAANQMTNDGTNTLTYDNNGNLTGNGTDTYTWDSANRLLSVGNHSYVYDGLGTRVQQTVSSVVTDYLNDVQPGLTKLLKQTNGANIDRFVHGVRGIHAVDDGTDWNFYAQDGLGSVRATLDDAGVVQSRLSYDPYGMPLGTTPDNFGFTGEQTDANGSVFLRARYYEPELGTFIKQDPLETPNRYAYVEGNPINLVDPTGLQSEGIWGWITEQIAQEMISFNNSVATVHDVANRVSTTTRQLGALSNALVQDTNAFISNPCNLVGDPTDPYNLSAISTWFTGSGVRIVSEPHDWGYTINDWRQGNYHHVDWLGFLPLVPAIGSLRRGTLALEGLSTPTRNILPALGDTGQFVRPTSLIEQQTLYNSLNLTNSRNSIVLDLFGGEQSQLRNIPEYSNAFNVDLIAREGVVGSALDLPFANNSVNEIVMNNPYIPHNGDVDALLQLRRNVYSEASRVLMPDGLIIVNANRANDFRILPSSLDNTGISLISQGSLNPIFSSLVFRRSNGSEISHATMETWIYLNR